jgi:hypothetical protein
MNHSLAINYDIEGDAETDTRHATELLIPNCLVRAGRYDTGAGK